MKRFVYCAMVALLFAVTGGPVHAQVDRATIGGFESRDQTSETGAYQIVNLIPGRYTVEAELQGFKNRDVTSAATMGTITSLASDPRTMQIAAPFTF